MAAFTTTHNKGPYKKPIREIAKCDIRRFIVEEGLTNRQISERLNIPLRSVERYISQLYEHDNQLLAGLNSNEEMLTVTNICRDRMTHYRQEIMENIARNQEASFKDRLLAWNLICELEAADLRLMDNAVELVARRSSNLSNNNRLVVKGSTAVNLELKKPLRRLSNNNAAEEEYRHRLEE